MTSQKKIEANRRNALKSTGPTTIVGKQAVRMNAKKHGLLSSELLLSAADQEPLEELRRALWEELRPTSPLLELSFEEVISSYWTLKQAIRIQQNSCRELLAIERSNVSEDDLAKTPVMVTNPYQDTPHQLRKKLRLLEEWKQMPLLKSKWSREVIPAAFGADFYQAVTQWLRTNEQLLLMLRTFEEKSRKYGMPLPKPKQETADETPSNRGKSQIQVGLDAGAQICAKESASSMPDPELIASTNPFAEREMALKLIECKQHDLLEKLLYLEQKKESNFGSTQETRMDLGLRYLNSAKRNLSKSIENYFSLKESLGGKQPKSA